MVHGPAMSESNAEPEARDPLAGEPADAAVNEPAQGPDGSAVNTTDGDTRDDRTDDGEATTVHGPGVEAEPAGQVIVAVPERTPEEAHENQNRLWGQAARAVALGALVGMGSIAWLRLTFDRSLTLALLTKNELAMPERNILISQHLGGAVLGALVVVGALVVGRKRPSNVADLERTAWFVSPLMLLAAVPVVGAHQAWYDNHESLLPIVLFLALLTERLVSQSAANVPPSLEGFFSFPPAPSARRVEAFVRRHGWLIAIALACVAYAAFMGFYSVRWHNKLGTATFDLGINNNLMYGGLFGNFNQSTVIFPDDPQKYIANHLKVGIYYFLPIYALHPRAETLLAIQATMVGLGALPLFLFARTYVRQWQAAVLALAYLAYYPMHGATFHENLIPTAAFFVLTLMWAVERKRTKLAAAFFVLALLMREDMGIPLAVYGSFLLLTGHRARAGAAIAAVSIAWFVFIRFKVMMDYGSWWFPNMYETLWSKPETGFRSVVKTLISNPTFVLDHIFVEKKFWYLMHLLVPVAFLPVRRWYLWAALVPGAFLTLLVTDYDPPIMFSFHYVMHWAPYLFAAAAVAIALIGRSDPLGEARRVGAIVAVAVASLALTYNYGAFPRRDRALRAGYHHIKFGWSKKEEAALRHIHRMVADIPESASVASTERIGAHLSSRQVFYTLRRGHHDADYIVANKKGLALDRTSTAVKDALRGGEYGVFGRYGEFVVLKRGADPEQNDALSKEWGLARKKRTRSADADEESSSRATDEQEEDSPEAPDTDSGGADPSKGPIAEDDATLDDSPHGAER